MRPGALLLAAALAGCAVRPPARPPDDMPAALSLEGRLSDHITDPPALIRQRSQLGDRYRVVRAIYGLDGQLLFARRFDELRPPPDGLDVFEGRIRPGSHELLVILELEGNRAGRLVQQADYHVTLRSTRRFAVGEGEFTDVTVVARERGDGGDGAGRPELEVRFGFKPAAR